MKFFRGPHSENHSLTQSSLQDLLGFLKILSEVNSSLPWIVTQEKQATIEFSLSTLGMLIWGD